MRDYKMLLLGEGPSRYGLHQNVLHVCWSGPPSLAEAKMVIRKVTELAREYGQVYLITDVTWSSLPTQEVRKCFASTEIVKSLVGSAVVVRDPILRAMARIMTRAQQILFGASYDQAFFQDVAAAWGWILMHQQSNQTHA